VSWMNVLIAIAVIHAIGGWIVVAFSAIQIFLLIPKGQRLAGYNDLSMWRFGKLRERIGPGSEPLFARMKLGGIVFALSLLAILLLTAVGIPFLEQAPAAGTAALSGPTNGVSNA
jgi:hypothetical protein